MQSHGDTTRSWWVHNWHNISLMVVMQLCCHLKCNVNEFSFTSTSWVRNWRQRLENAPVAATLTGNIALMIVCSYFESLKSYIALKLTITKKVANMQHTALRGHLWGATVPILIFLKRSRHADLKSFTTYHFWDNRGQMAFREAEIMTLTPVMSGI